MNIDAVNRKEVIDQLHQSVNLFEAEDRIKELTPVGMQQIEWVPIDKDLPKENGWYECTCEVNNSTLVMDLYFYANQKQWKDNRRLDMFHTYEIYGYGNKGEKHLLSIDEIDAVNWTNEVIAWRTLPESYKKTT